MPNKGVVYDNTPKVKSGKGAHDGDFIGFTTPYVWKSEFPQDKCKWCKGTGESARFGGTCDLCKGDGRRTETRVKLQYQLYSGVLEEEEVNASLRSSGSIDVTEGDRKVTKMLSPTTFFVRLTEFSNQGVKANELSLNAWYSDLKAAGPIKIPVQVIIGNNKNQTGLKITGVNLREVGSSNGASRPAPVANGNTASPLAYATTPSPIPQEAVAYIEPKLQELGLPEDELQNLAEQVSSQHGFSTYQWTQLKSKAIAWQFYKAAEVRAEELKADEWANQLASDIPF